MHFLDFVPSLTLPRTSHRKVFNKRTCFAKTVLQRSYSTLVFCASSLFFKVRDQKQYHNKLSSKLIEINVYSDLCIYFYRTINKRQIVSHYSVWKCRALDDRCFYVYRNIIVQYHLSNKVISSKGIRILLKVNVSTNVFQSFLMLA